MTLRVFFLGQFRLTVEDIPLELPSRPAQSLLAYLVLNPGMAHRREKLAGLLWSESDEANARSYLRQALWRVRKTLESAPLRWEEFLKTDDVSITFDQGSDYWVDTDIILGTNTSHSADDLILATSLYRGELLAGFLDEWVAPERERVEAAFNQKMAALLEYLLDYRRFDEVVRQSEFWLSVAHFPEPAYRALIRAYAELGELGMVTAVYRRCVASLDKELAVKPSLETQQLYENAMRGELRLVPTPPVIHEFRADRPPAFLGDETNPPIQQALFVVREREINQLMNFLSLAVNAQGNAAFVMGEAGSGKTSLLSEFARQALLLHPEMIIVNGGCNAQTGVGDPYLPFREMLEMLTGDVEGPWAAGVVSTAHARILWQSRLLLVETLLSEAPDLIDTFVSSTSLIDRVRTFQTQRPHLLNRLREMSEKPYGGIQPLKVQQTALFEQYTRLLKVFSRHVPILLIIDDLQWADLGSLSLLFHLCRNLAGFRILVVGTYRFEEVTLGRNGSRHPLEPVINELQRLYGENAVNLDTADGREFVDALLDSQPNRLGPSFRFLIHQQTHGNPLFTIEFLRGLQERGDLNLDDHGLWFEGPSLDWETLPARVEAVIAERISRLPPLLQAFLQAASVEGEVFTAEVLADVHRLEDREILEHLGRELDKKHRLIHAHSISRRDGQPLSCYRFRHNLFQRYLYNNLDEVERVHLHEQVGNALERLYGGPESAENVATQLVRHYTEARIVPKAVFYSLKAGRMSVAISACQEGVVHLRNGLSLLGTMPPTPERDNLEIELQIALGFGLQDLEGSQSPAFKLSCMRALELYPQTGDYFQLSQILGSLVVHHYVISDHEAAYDFAMSALKLAEQAADPLLTALGHWYIGLVYFVRAEFQSAREHLSYLISIDDSRQNRNRLISIRGSDARLGAFAYDACCLWALGYPDQASRCSQDTLAKARDFGQSFTLADVLTYAGGIFYEMSGDWSALKWLSDEFHQFQQREKFGGWQETDDLFRALSLVKSGKLSKGIRLLRETLKNGEIKGIRLHVVNTYMALAEAYGLSGMIEEGLDCIRQGFARSDESGENIWRSELHRIEAGLLLMQGDADRAERCLYDAVKEARKQDARVFQLRATVDLARLLQKQQRIPEAREVLSECYNWFTEGFNTADLIQARELLDELT